MGSKDTSASLAGGFHTNDDDCRHIDLDQRHRWTLTEPRYRSRILNEHNFLLWAHNHEKLLRGRGVWGIVSGSLPRPPLDQRERLKNWLLADRWAVSLLYFSMNTVWKGQFTMNTTRKENIDDRETSKAIWDTMKLLHGCNRLMSLLMQLWNYVKGPNESVDQMYIKMMQLRTFVRAIDPKEGPADPNMAVLMMKACSREYTKANGILIKTLTVSDTLVTTDLVLKHLRNIEKGLWIEPFSGAYVAKPGSNRNGHKGNTGRKDKSHIRCWRCEKKGHYRNQCTVPEEAL